MQRAILSSLTIEEDLIYAFSKVHTTGFDRHTSMCASVLPSRTIDLPAFRPSKTLKFLIVNRSLSKFN